MKGLFFLLFTMSLVQAETFKILGRQYVFQEKDGLVLYGCETKCEAIMTMEKYKTISLGKARAGKKYASSIGSDVCDSVYKARSVLGINEAKDGRAFCVFKDSSMIEINSLTDYLISKKITQ